MTKKSFKYLPVILFPYFEALNITLFLFAGYLSEIVKPLSIFLIFIFIVMNAAELILLIKNIIFFCKDLLIKNDYKDSVKKIVNIKLMQIPAYIYIFIFGFSFIFIPLGFIFTIFCFIADSISIFITGFLMSISLLKCYKEKNLSKSLLILHGLISFVFCLDVLDGFYLRRDII